MGRIKITRNTDKTCSFTYLHSGRRHTYHRERFTMYRLEFDPLPPFFPEVFSKVYQEENKTIFDFFMEGKKWGPLKNAYVLFIRAREYFVSQEYFEDINWEGYFICRTNQKGEVIMVSEDSIDYKVPQETSIFNGNLKEGYLWPDINSEDLFLYYWTFSREDFDRVLADVKNNYVEAVNRHEFYGLNIYGYQLNKTLNESWKQRNFELLRKCLGDPFKYKYSFELLHIVKSVQLGRFGVDWSDGNTIYARSRVIDSLYFIELMNCKAMSIFQEAANDFAVLEAAKDICKKTQEKERSPTLDEMIKTHRYYDDYWRYAFACGTFVDVEQKKGEMKSRTKAKKKSQKIIRGTIERTDFFKAIHNVVQLEINDRWFKAARMILDKYGVMHPADTHDPGHPSEPLDLNIKIKPIYDPPIMAYFDFYRFGTENKNKAKHYEGYEKRLLNKASRFILELRKVAENNLYYDDFLICLNIHRDENKQSRFNFHYRYLELALNLEYAWWDKVDLDNVWDKLDPHLKWLGVGADKGGELFGRFLGIKENVLKINEMLKSNKEKVEVLFMWLNSFSDKLAGRSVKREIIDRFEVDLEKGVVRVGRDKNDLGKKFRFLARVDREVGSYKMVRTFEEFVINPEHINKFPGLSKNISWSEYDKLPENQKQLYTRSEQSTKTFKIEPEFKTFSRWPSWLETMGDGISLMYSIKNLSDNFKKADILMTVDIFKDACQFVDSFSTALDTTFNYASEKYKWITKLGKVGKWAGVPGAYLEGFFNVREGITILYSEEGEMFKALEEDKSVKAHANFIKGCALVGSVVPGMVAAGGIWVSGASMGTILLGSIPILGIGLMIAGLTVLAIDIFIYLYEGPEGYLKKFEDEFKSAYKRECIENSTENKFENCLIVVNNLINTFI